MVITLVQSGDSTSRVLPVKKIAENEYQISFENAFTIQPGFLVNTTQRNQKLTGSKSKGRAQDYFYYYCTGGCKCRFRAEFVNDIFVNELKKFVPRPEYPELYQLTLQDAWYDQSNHSQDDKRQISNQITELEGRLTYLRDLLSTQKIEQDDYRKMKAEYIDKIEKLLGKLAISSQTPVDFDGLLNTGLQNLMNLERLYKNGDIVKKREITGSICPENLTIDGFGVRTARLNEAVSMIYTLGAGFGPKKETGGPVDTIFESFFDGFEAAGKDCGLKPNVLPHFYDRSCNVSWLGVIVSDQ